MSITNDLYMAPLVATAIVGIMIIASSFLQTANAQSTGSFQNMTSTLLKYAREHFLQAVEALDSNNVTGAVSEARGGMFYLDMLETPVYCVANDNKTLECGFVSSSNGMSQNGFPG